MKNKPYFQENGFTLYCQDCLKILPKLPEKSVDMVFADPPYFLSGGGVSCHSGRQVIVDKGDWDKPLSPEEKLKFNRKWICECRRVLKDNGTIWISGTLHNIYSIGVALELEGFSIINNITWQKANPAPNLACRCFTHSTETVLWARKQLSPKKKGVHFFDYELMKAENNGKQMKDVWLLPMVSKAEKVHGKHPTQKPLPLLKRIILCSTKEGALVLDPFNGSGTTGIAAAELGRKYIGIDNVEDYLKTTLKRYNDLRKE